MKTGITCTGNLPTLAWRTYIPGGGITGIGTTYGAGLLFTGSFENQQLALNASTGKIVWTTLTKGSSITVRHCNGKVKASTGGGSVDLSDVGGPAEQYFINHPDESIGKSVVDLITSAHDLSKIWKRFESYFETEEMRLRELVPEALLAFKNEKVLIMLKETEDELRHAQQQNDEERMKLLQVKFIVLNNIKMDLSRGLGDRIIVTPGG